MQSTGARIAVGIVAVAIVVIGFIALSGGDDNDSNDSTTASTATTEAPATDNVKGEKPDKGGQPASDPEPDVPVIEVVGGQPVDGVAELSFNSGDTIEFEVDSDTAAEVHMHGYDVAQDVEAGGTTTFEVPADIEGIFEVELEETATPIAEITVNP